MNRDTIIKLAREAGGVFDGGCWRLNAEFDEDDLSRFAALVAEKEREACADIVENADTPDCGGWTTQCIADRIRARNNHA